MWPTWVLWAPGGPHVGLMILAISLWTSNGKNVPWNGAVSLRSRTGPWETWSIRITLRYNRGAPADIHANALGILIICLQPHFRELCLRRGPDSLQCAGEWFCCRGFRRIVAGNLRGGSKALCQVEDEYIGNILYQFRDPRDRSPYHISGLKCLKNWQQKASEHVHAARRATNQRTARGLQLSEIENYVA